MPETKEKLSDITLIDQALSYYAKQDNSICSVITIFYLYRLPGSNLIYTSFQCFLQESNPALRLKDDLIVETGSGGGRIEENGQIKRRESPDFDDQNDLSGLEDENLIGGGLQRDISVNKKVKSLSFKMGFFIWHTSRVIFGS